MSNFDNLPRDGSSAPIPVGLRVQYKDGSTVPNESPVAISNSVVTLIPPDGALQVELTSADTIFSVSDTENSADGYEDVAIGFQKIVHCGAGNPIYVSCVSSGTLSTAWVMGNR